MEHWENDKPKGGEAPAKPFDRHAIKRRFARLFSWRRRTTAEPIPPEFVIDESALPVEMWAGQGRGTPWQAALAEVRKAATHVRNVEQHLKGIEETQRQEKKALLLHFIEDVVDNLDRKLRDLDDGAEQTPAVASWIRSFRLVHKQAIRVLAREGVTPHDVLLPGLGDFTVEDVVPRDDVPDGTILEVRQRGYLWRGEILRTGKGVVAQNDRSFSENLPDDSPV